MRSVGLIVFGILAGIGLVEVMLRVGFSSLFPVSYVDSTLLAAGRSTYTSQQLDPAIGLYGSEQGGGCVTSRPQHDLRFAPYLGLKQRELNSECAARLFDEDGPVSVAFLGGSVMANSFAPNVLTTIDTAVQDALESRGVRMRSVNLAESGSRSTNEFVRLTLEVDRLHPDVVVFLDGYNEFSALRYGVDPGADYYWGMRADPMLHHPVRHLFAGVAHRSYVLRLVLERTGFIAAGRSTLEAPFVERAAETYRANVFRSKTWCDARGYRCLFFIQPTLFGKSKLSPEEQLIRDRLVASFPGWDRAILEGMSLIENRDGEPQRSLSSIFADVPDRVFIDDVHLLRDGNRRVGEAIGTEIARELGRGGG